MDAPIVDKRRGTITDRVLRKLPDTFTDDCFNWPGKRNEAGYGLIRRGGKSEGDMRVTKVVYEHFIGPMNDRLIMHTCDNPPCVNPKHLVQGSDADNMKDKVVKGRMKTKLTAEQVREIRSAPRGSQSLALQHGVSYTTIKLIRSRKTWAWLD